MSQGKNHNHRDLVILLLIMGGSIVSVVIIVHIFLVDPVQKKIEQNVKDFNNEKKHVEIMSCSELKNGLLHDTIQWSENIQRASERYIGGCE